MSDFNSIINKIEQQRLEMERKKQEFLDENQKAFKEIVKQFFEEYPKVQCISWNQYTPYFNDGEECVFGVGEVYFIMRGFDKKELPSSAYEWDNWDYGIPQDDHEVEVLRLGWGFKEESYEEAIQVDENDSNYAKEKAQAIKLQGEKYPGYFEACRSFRKVISNNEDLMKEVFGDHSTVYVTKDEIIVEEFDHD